MPQMQTDGTILEQRWMATVPTWVLETKQSGMVQSLALAVGDVMQRAVTAVPLHGQMILDEWNKLDNRPARAEVYLGLYPRQCQVCG